jgi:hydroxymethylpyrimidine/phosphomethylpyrimidine kinase
VPLVLHLGQRAQPPADAADEDDADDLLAATLELVLPQTDLLIIEHLRLAQWHADGDIDIGDAPTPMHALLAAGAEWVLVLGSPQRPGHYANMLLGPNGQTATLPWQAPPDRNGDAGGVAATAIAAMLARGLEMPEAVRQGLAHADAAVAASFLPGMGRRIPNRIPSQ